MVDDKILGTNGGENVTVEFPNSLGKADIEGGKEQLWVVRDDELIGVGETKKSGSCKN